MPFNTKLTLAFLIALSATLATFGLAPLVQDFVAMLNANVIVSTAIGLPVLTTASLLVALIALQR